MSDRRGRIPPAVVVLVVACVLAAAVTPAAVAAGLEPIGGTDVAADGDGIGAGADDAVGDEATAPSVSLAAAVDGGSHTGRNAIGPGLRSANGTVEVVVRFEDTAQIERSRANGGTGVSTADLKTNAAGAQAEFDRFAAGNGAISVDRGFWLANAKLVTVDTDRVPIDRLLDV
ncbi:peptidase S8/S53 subtilisin kexin sedolisin, partial [Halorubrum sp. SD626R]